MIDANGFPIKSDNSKVFRGDLAPCLKNAVSYGNTEVVVFFSEAVDIYMAENPGNYSIPGLTVFSATMDTADPARIKLVTSSQGDGISYTLTVNNVTDLTHNRLTAPNFMNFIGIGIIDTYPPMILSANLIDSNTVELQFSEPVEQSSSETPGNYHIEDGSGIPETVTAAVRQTDISRVWLDIAGTFSESLYILTAGTSITDLNFNSLLGPPDNRVSFSGEGPLPQTFNDDPVIVDPMSEGPNNFSMLAKYRGRIYIGPADADNMVFRMKPDGASPELVSFAFHVGATYTSSLDPGPDGEDGIDYITGGIINGKEYLFIGPSKSGGNLDYIYFTSGSGNTLNFEPMDLSDGSILGGQTKGVSSMIVFSNKLYIGFPDTGSQRPYLLKIKNIIQNPVTDADVFNLSADKMPRIGVSGTPKNNAGTVGIDSFGIFNNILYLANGGNNAADQDGGILRSTNIDPSDYGLYPGDWEDVTPTPEVEWYNDPLFDRFSTMLPGLNKLVPADKAFPAMAVFNNTLYVIRNTKDLSGHPQLWKFDGSLWSLVANNGIGLTDMGNSNNNAVSLLVVNGDRLYIGYDNQSDGVQVWRTLPGVTDPVFESDFEPVSTTVSGILQTTTASTMACRSRAGERIFSGFCAAHQAAAYGSTERAINI